MRWTLYPRPRPITGDRRFRSWFAWLPVTIGLETRWLERVTVWQSWYGTPRSNFGGWDNMAFSNEVVQLAPEES